MGDQERECLVSGLWSGNQPVCSGMEIFLLSNSQMIMSLTIRENPTYKFKYTQRNF